MPAQRTSQSSRALGIVVLGIALAVFASLLFAGAAEARHHHKSWRGHASWRGKRSPCRRCHRRPPKPRRAPAPAPAAAPTTVSQPQPQPEPAAEPQPEAPAPESEPSVNDSIYLGATVGGGVYGESNPPWNMRPWETFESHIDHKLAILQVHQSWGSIDPNVLERIMARGAVPMLITSYKTLSEVADGSQDSNIRAMNKALIAYGGPVLFRWDWEMNGDWYPWGGASQAQEWVAAYRHLHDVLTAPNVSWIWNPNVYFPGLAPGKGVPVDPTPWWPGADYVDWMGADGYNYGGESFGTLFGPVYKLFQKLAPEKPIILPEWGASDSRGRKVSFIEEAFALTESRYPAIKAMVYYNDVVGSNGMDWPLEQLPAAQAAYRDGAADPHFSAMPDESGKLAVPGA